MSLPGVQQAEKGERLRFTVSSTECDIEWKAVAPMDAKVSESLLGLRK